MQLETQEEKELWKQAVCAVLQTERCGWQESVNTGDLVVEEFRKRTYEQVDTQI
jgi:hypothetical protein